MTSPLTDRRGGSHFPTLGGTLPAAEGWARPTRGRGYRSMDDPGDEVNGRLRDLPTCLNWRYAFEWGERVLVLGENFGNERVALLAKVSMQH